MMNEELFKIKQIVEDTDRDMDRLTSQRDKLRIEAYEEIRKVLGYTDYIPVQNKDA